MQATQEQVEWINKNEAAKRLKVAPRTVLAMAKDRTIKSKRERNPNTNQVGVLLHAGDIERLCYERDHPNDKQGVQTVPKRALQLVQTLPVNAPRLWLTIVEAAEYSGLPAGFLVQLIESRGIPALDVGRRAGGHWRVSRRDLDALKAPGLDA